MTSGASAGDRASILVLYEAPETFVGTIHEHLRSFAQYSRHAVSYAAATHGAAAVDLDDYDAVVVHYSVRICLDDYLSPAYRGALAEYRGPKLLFIQDEYDTTETTRRNIEALGIDVVFTCVPERYRELVYPRPRFPRVQFEPTLTGYVPSELEGKPPARGSRPVVIGYRGRELPYWYGDLGREKVTIARRMKEYCKSRGIPVDIEWEEQHRIYGPQWFDFLRRCKATLGTESGSNVFDDRGEIRRAVEALLAQRPDASYEDVHAAIIAPHEGRVVMNQVSPRIFEAIACGTALVLFEGTYSGVVEQDRHYIPLRKDFANVDEVLARLADDDYVAALAQRAYEDVVASGRYSYRAFVSGFDRVLAPRLGARRAARPAVRAAAVPADRPLDRREWKSLQRSRLPRPLAWLAEQGDAVKPALRPVWRALPSAWRETMRAAAGRAGGLMHRLVGR